MKVGRTLYCQKCGQTVQEELTYPWFVRFGVAMHCDEFMLPERKESNEAERAA